jgi:MFS family permease
LAYTLTGTAFLASHVFIVFMACLAIGAPLPALAVFVHADLGYAPWVVGWVIGLQSIATVLTRHRAGTLTDMRGPKRAVLTGLPLLCYAGLLYLATALAPLSETTRLAILLAGRIMMGLGESLVLTGAMSWSIARLGPAKTGTIMSWQGIAIYAAFGIGAPLGIAIQSKYGFAAVSLIPIVSPLVALAAALLLKGAPAVGGERVPFYTVIALIWRQGLVLTLATVPFAAMATFLVLDYAAKGWRGAGLALAGFGCGYVLVRVVGSSWPDRYGGFRVAAVSLAVEAVGQALVWLAPGPDLNIMGAIITGLGFSLIFPAMGVDATRRVPASMRGRAVGNFIAFFDVAIGLTGPLVGLFVGRTGYPAVFLLGCLATLGALGLVLASRRGLAASPP